MQSEAVSEQMDFSFMSKYDAEMLESAYKFLSPEDLAFLKVYEPNFDVGFMFSKNNKLDNIQSKIHVGYSYGHSGASIAYVLRMIEQIEKEGFDAFRQSYSQ
jgi:hypothetical protein